MTIETDPKPEPSISHDPPQWVMVVGISFLGFAVIFVATLIILNLFGMDIEGNGRLLVAALLALVTSIGSGFLGGSAAASGQIQVPKFLQNPVGFGVTGGVAVFVIVFIITIAAFGYLSEDSSPGISNNNEGASDSSPSPTPTTSLTPPSKTNSAPSPNNFQSPTDGDTPIVTPTNDNDMSQVPTNDVISSPTITPPSPSRRSQVSSPLIESVKPVKNLDINDVSIIHRPMTLASGYKLSAEIAKDMDFTQVVKKRKIVYPHLKDIKIALKKPEKSTYWVRLVLESPNGQKIFSNKEKFNPILE